MLSYIFFTFAELGVYLYCSIKLISNFSRMRLLVFFVLLYYKSFGFVVTISMLVAHISLIHSVRIPIITMLLYEKIKNKSAFVVLSKFAKNYITFAVCRNILMLGDAISSIIKKFVKLVIDSNKKNYGISSIRTSNPITNTAERTLDDADISKLNGELDAILNLGLNIIGNISSCDKSSQNKNVGEFIKSINDLMCDSKNK